MTRVPDPLVELLRQGALDPPTAAQVRARLAATPDGAARLAALDDDDRAILAALPPGRFAEEVHRRSRAVAVTAPKKRAGWLAAAAAATCAALLVVVIDTPPAERAKGSAPTLVLHRLVDGAPESLPPGTTLAAGDLVQLSVVADGRGFGVVVSLDGEGAASLHRPSALDGDTALAPGVHPTDHAWEIDDAAAFERFVLVVDDAPLDPRAVLAAAKAIAQNPLTAREAPLAIEGKRITQTSIVFTKEPR